LFGQFFLVARHRVGLHHGVIVIVEIENIRRNAETYRVAFASITVHINSHDTLLEAGLLASPSEYDSRSLDPKTRTCYNRE
jgi:hypothetical protein